MVLRTRGVSADNLEVQTKLTLFRFNMVNAARALRENQLRTIEEWLVTEGLPASFRSTVEQVCMPVATHIADQVRIRQSPQTVGLCGAQGSGKSTIASVLKILLEERGLSVAVMSLDDLYLTRDERIALSELVHPLLKTRGVPGTHDVGLGIRTLLALGRSGVVTIPSFDKSQDDRRPPEDWPRICAPVEVILFEGWCVGAIPEDDDALAVPINALERDEDAEAVWRRYVNGALAGDYQHLFRLVDTLILLEAPSFDVVLQWRLEQERKLRSRIDSERSTRVMDDAEVALFVCHYERITRHILAEMPPRADMLVKLDAARRPLALIKR